MWKTWKHRFADSLLILRVAVSSAAFPSLFVYASKPASKPFFDHY
jgi:hypothetical protein